MNAVTAAGPVPAEPETTTGAGTTDVAPAAPRGHIGRIVTSTVVGGLLGAVLAVAGPFAGAEEHVITAAVLATFAIAWGLLAVLSTRWTDQPQRWAIVPAGAMGAASATVLLLAPTGNELGWVWPPALIALVGWMVVRSRRALRSRARVLVLYPVFAALALSALGGAYETYRETGDPAVGAMPGRLVDVGGHRLHISCTGSGSPTVVLEPGLGEASPTMAAWIAPDVAATTRVCVYDRAGRGWSESADGPQDGTQVATDLHTLLARAGEPGPYVLAGHSSGGIYVLDFAERFPGDVAGVVLLDSMHPEQYERMPSWPGFYEMYRRVSAVAPSLSRLGLGRLVYGSQYGDLPAPQRDQERAFLSTPRHARSVRDEFDQIRTAMGQAAALETLGDVPLAVVTAAADAEPAWFAMQDDLVTLSSDSLHLTLADATHAMVVEDEDTARSSSQAILDVVSSVRTATPIDAAPTPSTTSTAVDRPSQLVDRTIGVDGGRLHLRCMGSGVTTVLLIAGWGDGGDGSWGAVQPAIAEHARVCTYDRFGTGASDAPPTTQTFTTQAADLHTLLDRAGEPGPYVVVGHSFGGAEAVSFAAQHRDEVVGLVLVDASPTTWPDAVCAVPDDGTEAASSFRSLCARWHDPSQDAEQLDVFRAFEEVAAISSLDRLPLAVVSAAHRTAPGLSEHARGQLDAAWDEGVTRWAALSTTSTVVTVDGTGHYIQLERPDLVVELVGNLLP